MITVVNFGYPVNRAEVEALIGPFQEVSCPVHLVLDGDRDGLPDRIVQQVQKMVDGLTIPWTTEPIVVVLPSLSLAAGLVLAELTGRMGHLPTILFSRERKGEVVRQYEIAGAIDLQAVRNTARQRRVTDMQASS